MGARWKMCSPRLLWRQDFILSKASASWKLAPTWENSHPHGKTCTHVSLWRQDFHRVEGKCKLETRTHMGELAPTSLVATRFHLVEGKCKLETRTHMGWENLHPHGKTRTHMGKRAPTWESLRHADRERLPGHRCRARTARPIPARSCGGLTAAVTGGPLGHGGCSGGFW